MAMGFQPVRTESQQAPMPDTRPPDTPPSDGRSDGAPMLHCATTHDIDEQAALLSGWNQSYAQISPGTFDGSIIDVEFGPARLFREVTSSSLHQLGELPPDLVAVGVPISLNGPATFCGQPCDGRQLHVFSGNDAFEFFSPCGLDIVGFVVGKAELRDGLAADDSGTLEGTATAPHLMQISQCSADMLRQLFADICQTISNEPQRAARPEVINAMLADVRTAVVAAVTCSEEIDPGLSPARRMVIVRRVRDLVTECPEHYQNVEALCSTLGISRRTLQMSFQETLGVKPSAFLRAVRLNGARRALKCGASVTDAATLWGFWHFGRFAHDYRAMFGERPSDTARGRAEKPAAVP